MHVICFRLKLGKLKQSDSGQYGKVVMDACVIISVRYYAKYEQ